MSADPAALEAVVSPWAGRRLRAEALRARHPFAAELMTLYLALLPVQEEVWSSARESPPPVDELPGWVAIRVLPAVVEATVLAGPAVLAEAAPERIAQRALAGWLAGEELDPVDRYLARASLGPVLEALGERAGAACAGAPASEDGEVCPRCGGLPQLSFLASSGDKLVSGPRSLLCSRCGFSWQCSRSVCPACGEKEDDRLWVYAEQLEGPVSGNGKHEADEDRPALFPHLRIAGCSTCERYLIEVDMARDARAVPEVDELAALPLDLHAADQGLTKLTPNLMGF
ncbi:MAG TPA: formate dehydrogenase accessory protein FdhE [Thermoleophilaceae bacterium]|jgi:ribosomal protein L37E|nr:formate dehydrogenase accessory protein FdhE [Thermoleophilaceae bacterium]